MLNNFTTYGLLNKNYWIIVINKFTTICYAMLPYNVMLWRTHPIMLYLLPIYCLYYFNWLCYVNQTTTMLYLWYYAYVCIIVCYVSWLTGLTNVIWKSVSFVKIMQLAVWHITKHWTCQPGNIYALCCKTSVVLLVVVSFFNQ